MEYSLKIKDIQMSDSKPIHIYIIKKQEENSYVYCILQQQFY